MTFPVFSRWARRLAKRRRSDSVGRGPTPGGCPLFRLYLACWLTLLASAGNVRAEGGLPGAEIPSLSFDDVVTTALSRHLSLEAARLEIDRAQALLQQARASALPTLTLGFNYTRLDNDRVLGSGDMQRLVAGANQTAGNLTLAVPILAPARWAGWLHAR
ncbi:MAG TPA: TolC family protein, partial [Pseudomonadota bacterium]|nr:TolC family protein [Pseudomonadota bacterium]